ncbi:MAG TPA: ABC transporter ATP-binding protein [Planctomycetota bacterium]|jgi:putative ABC transport system ATP-binding protein|nr:ABC transporter ATP-binding protein [Planctomycetota bacterium]
MMLCGRDLRLVYKDAAQEVRAVDGVSVEIREGEFVGLLGPSGSGKSSLLYLLAGLKRPTSGEAAFAGRSYAALGRDALAGLRRENFGFVFQNHFLINHLTALENIRTSGAGDDGRLLEDLHAGHCRDKFPWQMSAGEKQRVAIARAVVHRPKVVFADEPTASLDRPNADLVVECLRRVTQRGTLFVVTHDEAILKGASRILRMNAGRFVDNA